VTSQERAGKGSEPVHVLLDTCIYRSSGWLQSSQIEALSRAAERGSIVLHMPWMVEGEYRGYLKEGAKKRCSAAVSAVDQLGRQPFLAAQTRTDLEALHQAFEAIEGRLLNDSDKWFDEWQKTVKAERHALETEDSRRVFELYFQGAPPFRAARSRIDLPDAFISEVALRVVKSIGTLHVITDDGQLGSSLREAPNIILHRTLDRFLDYPTVASVLVKVLVSDVLTTWITTDREDLERQLAERFPRSGLGWGTVVTATGGHDMHIRGEVQNVRIYLKPSTLRDYGEGVIGVDFVAEADGEVVCNMSRMSWDASAPADTRAEYDERYPDWVTAVSRRPVQLRGEAGLKIPPDFLARGRENDLKQFLKATGLGVRVTMEPSAIIPQVQKPQSLSAN